METEKRQRGRPKKEGSIEAWQFARAAIVMCAYDEARENGQKHSVAIKYAVNSLRQHSPEMPISETEVKRILSTFRPRRSETILRFERSTLSEEDVRIKRWVREQLAAFQGKKGLILPVPPNYDLAQRVAVFAIRFADRPDYPRHNRKNRKELTQPIDH